MSAQPLVSILIPSYNHERFLPAAIESALAQSYRPIEVVVVDDGSTDASLAVAQAYAAQYPELIRVLTHPGNVNRGISATINLAAREARGKYLSPFASDDILCSEKLAHQVASLESNPLAGMAYGCAETIDAYDNKLGTRIGVDISDAADPMLRLIRGNVIPGATVLLRAACLDSVGMWDPGLVNSDWDLWLRIVAEYKLIFINQTLALYRRHNTNTSWGQGDPSRLIEWDLHVLAALKQRISSVPIEKHSSLRLSTILSTSVPHSTRGLRKKHYDSSVRRALAYKHLQMAAVQTDRGNTHQAKAHFRISLVPDIAVMPRQWADWAALLTRLYFPCAYTLLRKSATRWFGAS